MIRSIGIAVIITVCMLWAFSALMDSAMADVTGAGSTTNDQVTSGSSSSNTAITGGYHSEATTNYQSGPQPTQPTTITTPIQETLELCLQHLLLASLLCLKICVLLALV